MQRGHTPNIDLQYANGAHDGQAYLNTRRAYYALIGGSKIVRERFTVTGSDRKVTSMMVRVSHQSGSGLLKLRLEKADGTLIEQHTVPGSTQVASWSLGTTGDMGDWVGVDSRPAANASRWRDLLPEGDRPRRLRLRGRQCPGTRFE